MEMMSELSRTALEATDLAQLLERVADYIRARFLFDVEATTFDAAVLSVPIVHHGATLGVLRFERARPTPSRPRTS
jgi:hypothetical protein